MATGKRFYWIKLKDSFMSSDEIDYLMSQPDGANYVVLYQMLCLKTINTGGCLVSQIGEMLIPYDAEKIQRECPCYGAPGGVPEKGKARTQGHDLSNFKVNYISELFLMRQQNPPNYFGGYINF